MTARRFLAFLACLVAGCEWFAAKPLAPVAESGELVVLTVNGPATYHEDAEGHPTGFEFDLATLFAKELGVPARFVLADDPRKIEPTLRRGQAHLAAAALTRGFDFPGGVAWGPTYFRSRLQVVWRSAEPRPATFADIAGRRVGVIEESIADHVLTQPPVLSTPIERLPSDAATADLLAQVTDGRLDFALVESTRFTLNRKFFPQLDVAFSLGREFDYAWLISPVDRARLAKAARAFFERIEKDGTLKRLADRYYAHAARISAIDAGTLLERIESHLPGLRPHFEEAERQVGVDWRLIAAVGYQESHWDALATSPTGVRGLMMLTEETAERLKVRDRLDARESILGGARYFAMLAAQLPARIPEPDRTFLALAAYNLGLGHLEDARILAQRSGLSPDRWQDVKQVLGRLADPAAYTTLKHGFARGHEALQFVDNVRNYHDILARRAPREAPLAPRAAAAQSSSNASVSPR